MTTQDGWNPLVMSHVAAKVVNPIRMIVDRTPVQPNPSLPVIKLSIGDPTIDGTFPPPANIVEAAKKALDNTQNNGYAPSYGTMDARIAIAKKYTLPDAAVTDSDVILACGCSGALDLAIRVLCNPGDSILLPCPGFSLYKTICESADIVPQFYKCLPEKQWEIDLADLEKNITPKTKVILINNPSNPCGSVFSRKHLEDIAKLARKVKLPIISDEIYANMSFDLPFVSMSEVCAEVPVLVCGGLAKQYVVPGWRIGWIVLYDRSNLMKEIREGLQKLSMVLLGPSTLCQSIIHSCLFETPQSYYDGMINKLKTAAKESFDSIVTIPGLKPVAPQGAMYMMVGLEVCKFRDIADDVEFYKKLLEEQSVLVLPASVFGSPNFFRIVFTGSRESLTNAFERIKTFCEAHKKE